MRTPSAKPIKNVREEVRMDPKNKPQQERRSPEDQQREEQRRRDQQQQPGRQPQPGEKHNR
jgi:hypothetical protein